MSKYLIQVCDEEGTLDCPQHESGAGGEDEECCGSGSGCGSGDEETTATTKTTTTTTTKITSTTPEQYTCQDGSKIPITKVWNLYNRPIHSSHFQLLFGYHFLALLGQHPSHSNWGLRSLSLIVENAFAGVWQHYGLRSTWKWGWRGGRGGLRWWARFRDKILFSLCFIF